MATRRVLTGWVPTTGLLAGIASVMACAAGSRAPSTTRALGESGGGGETPGFPDRGGDLVLGIGAQVVVPSGPCNVTDPDADYDGDGFSIAQGDCNDCSAQINPGAFDYPGNGVDEDCSGTVDDAPAECDASLFLESPSAIDGAKAMGLCKLQSGASFGLVTAKYVTADGLPIEQYDPPGLGHGILPGFGAAVHPQEGTKLLALSTGTARRPEDSNYRPVTGYDKQYMTSAPAGFPRESPACPGVKTGGCHDSIALAVTVKVPTNARSLSFDSNFFTYEFPDFICSEYNDFFVALLSSEPAHGGAPRAGNIAFDREGNLVSVNASFLQVCAPGTHGGRLFACPLGVGPLAATGFNEDDAGDPTDTGAATGWLRTTASVDPGSTITLRFAIWDSTDGFRDSTVLLDNFRWTVDEVKIETIPVEVPK